MADSILERILAMDVLAILLWIKEGAYSRIYLGVNSLSNKVIFPTPYRILAQTLESSRLGYRVGLHRVILQAEPTICRETSVWRYSCVFNKAVPQINGSW
jgi:hypothetical protein